MGGLSGYTGGYLSQCLNGLQWFAQVTVDFNEDLSTPARAFAI